MCLRFVFSEFVLYIYECVLCDGGDGDGGGGDGGDNDDDDDDNNDNNDIKHYTTYCSFVIIFFSNNASNVSCFFSES